MSRPLRELQSRLRPPLLVCNRATRKDRPSEELLAASLSGVSRYPRRIAPRRCRGCQRFGFGGRMDGQDPGWASLHLSLHFGGATLPVFVHMGRSHGVAIVILLEAPAVMHLCTRFRLRGLSGRDGWTFCDAAPGCWDPAGKNLRRAFY
jgi:hypothetical protein